MISSTPKSLEASINLLMAKMAIKLRAAIIAKDKAEIERLLSLLESGLGKDEPEVQS